MMIIIISPCTFTPFIILSWPSTLVSSSISLIGPSSLISLTSLITPSSLLLTSPSSLTTLASWLPHPPWLSQPPCCCCCCCCWPPHSPCPPMFTYWPPQPPCCCWPPHPPWLLFPNCESKLLFPPLVTLPIVFHGVLLTAYLCVQLTLGFL